MLLTANQTTQLTMTYRSAISAATLVYSTVKLVNRLFLLPTVDYLWGNACDWEDEFIKGYAACKHWFTTYSEFKTFLIDVFILLPFFLGKLASEKMNAFIEGHMKTAENTGLQGVEACIEQPENNQTTVNQSFKYHLVNYQRLHRIPMPTQVDQAFDLYLYTEPQADTVDMLDEPAPMKPRKRAKAAIVETLIKQSI